jgi:pimeloyl-ACP methyl ester carboxylesterase
MANIQNVVLVHGGFVDGAGWGGVYKILKRGGYHVSIVQNPTISLQDDAAATQRILAMQDGPAILVGHSYGGAVITEAGTHPKAAALVYITAFAPDRGESVATLIKDPPPGAPVPPILPPQDGYLFLDKAKFRASFAADVDPETAAFMADSQVPWGLGALSGAISEPAWRTQAKLVPGGHRGPDDSRDRPACDGQAGEFHDRRSQGWPRDLCLAAWSGCRADRTGGQKREGRWHLTKT